MDDIFAQAALKDPSATDTVLVSNPTTGVAGKSTIAQIVQAGINPSAISYTTVPSQSVQLSDPVSVLGTPRAVQIGSTVYNPGGRWIDALTFVDRWTESFDMSGISGISSGLSINYQNKYLKTLTAPDMVIIIAGISIATSNELLTVSMPKLVYSGGITITSSGLTTFNFPELTYVATLAVSASSLTSVNLPKLKYIGSLGSTFSTATSILLPALEVVDSSFSINAPLVTSVDLPELISFGGSVTSGTALSSLFGASLTYLRFPKLKRIGGLSTTKSLTFGSPFDQGTVDHILTIFAGMDGTSGKMLMQSWTINLAFAGAASPSATGLAAKATLVARGCTVTHN